MAWYTFHLARGLRAQGHDVFLSAQRDSPLAEWAASEGIPGNNDFNFHSTNPFASLQAFVHLRKTIAMYRPDILNPHCPPGHALLAIANQRKLPLIRTVAEPRPPKSHFINRFLHEKKTDGMIYSTASSVPRYSKIFNFSDRLEAVVRPGLDLSLFPEVPRESWRAKLDIPNDALFAAIVARMNPEKGQELLIEALTLLPDTIRKGIVVLLTGDDNRQRTAHDLKLLADSKGVAESLRFAPRLTDVRPLLSEIDLGMITSTRSEAVCRIALEYMAYGKPILSTDVNILSEVVRNDINGWCVSSTSPQQLADALIEAALNRQSLVKKGQSGLALLMKEFTLEKMTADTVAFYHKVSKSRERFH